MIAQQISKISTFTKATDLEKIRQITRPILGENCWEASLSYGDELCLEIGERIPYRNKLIAGQEKGAWRLGTRATPWKLEYQGKIIVNYDSEVKKIQQKAILVEHSAITAFDISYPDLMLEVGFSNGYTLRLVPDPDDDFELSYWELFTPSEMVLIADPGPVLSYIPSNLPIARTMTVDQLPV